MTDTAPHVHTSSCWKETGLTECMEHRIIELETLLIALQLELRKVGGTLDKAEGSINKTLQDARNVI